MSIRQTEDDRSHALVAFGLLLGLSLASCVGSAVPTARDGAADQGERVDSPSPLCAQYQAFATSAVPFAVVQRIFDDSCVSCHATGANLDLSEGRAWMDLVNRAAPVVEACGGTLVVPGDPTSSYLYQKLTNQHPCTGAQMPIDELFRSAPLPECATNLISDWINVGAPAPSPDGGDPTGG